MRTQQEQQIYAAIADPTRRHIIAMLAEQPTAVQVLADRFEISRPAVSRHLKILKRASLVTELKQGRQRIYSTNPQPLKEVQEWIRGFWGDRLQALKDFVE
jgi:DNA-binding transcriptional ArsR family regulator